MNHQDIEQNQVVDRYLMGKLPPAETTAFEEHYLHCQDCLDQLELTEKLWRGLKREAARDAERALASRQLGILAWLARHSRRRQLSLVVAALLVVAVLPVGLVYRVLDRDDQLAVHALTPLPQKPSHFYELGQLRSESSEHSHPAYRIPLPASPEPLPLKLPLGLAEYENYRVTLFREGVPDPVDERGFEPTDDDALIFHLSSAVLRPGNYTLRVDALGPGGEPVDEAAFSFQAFAEP